MDEEEAMQRAGTGGRCCGGCDCHGVQRFWLSAFRDSNRKAGQQSIRRWRGLVVHAELQVCPSSWEAAAP